MIAMNNAAMSSPGISPAMKSCPIDCSVSMPMIISVTLGGMMQPRLPTVATIPVERVLL